MPKDIFPKELLAILKAAPQEVHTGENQLWKAETADQIPFIVKKLRCNRLESFDPAAEIAWLNALPVDKVVRPFSVNHQSIIKKNTHEHFLLYKYIKGKNLDTKSLASYYKAGKLLRDLHDKGKIIYQTQVDSWEGFKRPFFNQEMLITKTLLRLNKTSYLNEQQIGELSGLCKRLYDQFPRDQGFIHGDFHLGNLLQTKQGIKALDFDECGFGSIYYDIGTMRLHTLSLNNEKHWIEFLKGYDISASDKSLNIGAAIRILYMMGKLPDRLDIPVVKKNIENILERYLGYIKKLTLTP